MIRVKRDRKISSSPECLDKAGERAGNRVGASVMHRAIDARTEHKIKHSTLITLGNWHNNNNSKHSFVRLSVRVAVTSSLVAKLVDWIEPETRFKFRQAAPPETAQGCKGGNFGGGIRTKDPGSCEPRKLRSGSRYPLAVQSPLVKSLGRINPRAETEEGGGGEIATREASSSSGAGLRKLRQSGFWTRRRASVHCTQQKGVSRAGALASPPRTPSNPWPAPRLP